MAAGEDGETPASEFEHPPEGPLDEEAEVEHPGERDVDEDLDVEIPPAMLEAKEGIESRLGAMVETQAAEYSESSTRSSESLLGERSIQGVGIGLGHDEPGQKVIAGVPGSPVLTVYLAEPASAEEVRALLVDDMGIEAAGAEEVPVQRVVTGVIEAFSHTFRMRPAPGGVSVAHKSVSAGTFGVRAIGRTAPRNKRALILSNNHVLANVNAGRAGDCVCQPGSADGGRCPRDQVAVLERYVPINTQGRPNYVDCATAWAWPDRIRRELVYPSSGQWMLLGLSSSPVEPRRGMVVGKSGRTTQLTRGTISATGATIQVGYGGGRTALFRDQMEIRRGDGRPFSLGGDSGSCIWTWTDARRPVGLLFAGGNGVTFANRLSRMLAALDIRLWTE